MPTFAKRLAVYAYGIVAHQLPEGINNKITIIKLMAYGLRDDEYFFLKIRSVFPGTPG